MENELNDKLDQFLSDDEDKKSEKKKKELVVTSDHSIIERIDKIIIAESGKQLLREQY